MNLAKHNLLIIGILINLNGLFGYQEEKGIVNSANYFFQEAEKALDQKNFGLALDLYTQAGTQYYFVSDTLNALISKAKQGHCLFQTASYQKAQELGLAINRDIDTIKFTISEEYIELLKIESSLLLNLQVELTAAKDYLVQVLLYKKEKKPQNLKELVELHSNLAGVQYYLGQFNKSLLNYNSALKLLKKDSLLATTHNTPIIMGLNATYNEMGLYSKAISTQEQLLNIFKQQKNQAALAWLFGSMGQTYKSQGFQYKAIQFFEEALRVFENLDQSSSYDAFAAKHNMGESYMLLYKYKEAVQVFKSVYVDESKTIGVSHPNHIYTFTSLSEAYKNFDLDSALYYLKKAKQLTQKHYGNKTNRYAKIQTAYGSVSRKANKHKQALEYFQKAQQIRVPILGTKHPEYLRDSYAIASLLHASGQFEKALTHVDSILEKNLIDPYEERFILKYTEPDLQVKAIGLKANIMKSSKAYSKEQSLKLFNQYDSISLILRKSSYNVLDRSALRSNFRITYENYIDLLVEQYSNNPSNENFLKALSKTEQFKYFTLYEKLEQGRIIEASKDTLYEVRNQLIKKISQVNLDIQNAGQSQIDEYRSEIFSLREQLEDLTLPPSGNTFQLPLISKSLTSIPEGETVISYFFTTEKLYVFILSNGQQEIIQIPTDNSIKVQIHKFRQMFTKNPNSDLEEFKKLSSALYNSLIKPVYHFLSDGNLLIIPDQELHLLPFEILISENNAKNNRFQDLPYLLKKFAIHYAPSLSTYKLLSNEKSLLNSPPVVITEKSQSIFQKKPLYWASKEAETLNRLFKKTITINTPDKKYLNTQIDNPLIIHFATHASANNQNPDYSHILLPLETFDNEVDNKLYAFEIYNSNLACEMAVLSACETGSGLIDNGEGVMNLANSFFHSGSRSVVFTKWLANDQSTYEIITSFYKYLIKGESKSTALRKAKIDYLKNTDDLTSHPFFWGHIAISGKNTPIKKSDNDNRKVLWTFLGLIILSILLRKISGKAKHHNINR